jgi:integrase
MAKKKANGEGSIYRRKDGRWVGQYTVQTPKGPKIRYIYGKTKAAVRIKLTKVMADRDRGLVFDTGSRTLGEYLDCWLKDSVRDAVKPSTYASYSRLTHGHLIPALGSNKLQGLTPDHVRYFRRSKLEAGLSTRTVQYLLTILRKALQQAVEDGLLPRNVAQGLKVKQVRKNEIRYLLPEQAKTLLRAARDDRLEALYVLAIHTGLRQGELLGLKWEDINLETGMLSVKRTLSAAKGSPRFTAPKTTHSRRSVKLTPRAIEALNHHQLAQNEQKSRLGSLWQDNDLVFPSIKGTPLNRHNLIFRSFKPLLKKAGLPHSVRFHDLRHTAATLLISKGLDAKIVQETLGHSSVIITLDIYAHLLPGRRDEATKAMEDALS